MLHEFLLSERENILALCSAKLLRLNDARSSSDEMELGLPVFYDELIDVLRTDGEELDEARVDKIWGSVHRDSAVRRGKESLKLGYTISQVVHGYGSLCQSITEYSALHADEPIQAREFNRLNFCLDVAIAEAVTEFSKGQTDNASRAEVQRLGFLAHELRNALANASTAHQLIKKGVVGFSGSTNQIFEDSLKRMEDIIDRSLSEVRLRGEVGVYCERCRVVDMVGEVEATSMSAAGARSVQLNVDVEMDLTVLADRHLVVSAISNLVQNAIKFTKAEGNVWVRGRAVGERALIEVEDQCGGLPIGKIEDLFKPFTQKSSDKSGMGLGLSISQRAIALNDGDLSATDLPGAGCIFTIDLPRAPTKRSGQSG